MAADPDQEPEAAILARSAMAAYRASLDQGDADAALRWLERAHRLVPNDPNIRLALAGALLGREVARAAQLFASVTEHHDVREAWLGLAVARLRLGATDQARTALSRALSRHTPRNDTRSVAQEVLRASGDDGWCALTFTGHLVLHTIVRETPVVSLDGRILPTARIPGGRLPKDWHRGARLSVMIEGRHLLGSPIDIAAIRRVEGIVDGDHAGLRGWAWYPADPGRPVPLRVIDDRGRVLAARADDPRITVADLGALAHPLGFTIPAEALARLGTTLTVQALDGPPLYGSPVAPLRSVRSASLVARDLAAEYPADRPSPEGLPAVVPIPADLPLPHRPEGAGQRRPAVSVVIPVHGQRALALACIDSVLETIAAPDRVVVVDDASPDQLLRDRLDDLARQRRIRLVRHDRNLGFSASVNAGIRASRGHDVVLLNSDTLVPPGWLQRLADAAHATRDIGTVTPLSNDASILSYPSIEDANPIPDAAETRRLDAMTRAANGQAVVDIPVGVGFCLYIRRDCLRAVGVFRDDVFAQGYGEENDFCLRARRLGWRHVALPSVFIAHRGGQSFNRAGVHLRSRNALLLERLHPGYTALVQAFQREDPLAPFRRRLDQRRWRARRGARRDTVVLITHDDAGGVEQRVRQAIHDHQDQGRSVIVLRPTTLADGSPAVALSDGGTERYPNLRFALPREWSALLRWLRAHRPVATEVHHFLGHHALVHDLPQAMGVPATVHVHDYAWFCPRVVLVDGRGRYCGEPAITACEACVADHGRLDGDSLSVPALRDRSHALLAAAHRVIAPSADTAGRIARHFPGIQPDVVPHQDDAAIPLRLPRPRPAGRAGRVCVLGSIGVHKGYDTLLACARDAAERGLDLEFVVVGSSIDDARLLDTGRVFITGSYEPAEAVDLVLRQEADIGFLPSIAPETWCMGLTELWRAGLRVAAFDIGAPAERIRATGRGFLLPPHLPPGAINKALATLMASSEPRTTAAANRNGLSPELSHIVAKGP